jgi:hypothetical protein
MAEFESTGGIILNGREINGRTYTRDDGSYETLDLSDVAAGDIVSVINSKGRKYQFLRLDHEEYASSLNGWQMIAESEDKFGSRALSLVLLDSESFLTPSVVLDERTELGVVDSTVAPHIIVSLGRVAAILPSNLPDIAANPILHANAA